MPDNYVYDTIMVANQDLLIAKVEMAMKHGWRLVGESYYKDGFYTSPVEKTRMYCQKLKRIRGGMIRV